MVSGTKYDKEKLRFDLIPVRPLEEVARVYTIGARKYADRNWEGGMKWGRLYGALLRHAFAWWWGERFDKDNGQHHLAAVVFNALALMEYEEIHPELDDRPQVGRPQTRVLRAATKATRHKTVQLRRTPHH